VTEESIREKGGFEDRIIMAERDESFPVIEWQDLAEMFKQPDFEEYPFLAEIKDPKVFFMIIGLVKAVVLERGKLVIDDAFYDEFGDMIAKKVAGLSRDQRDDASDLVFDFLRDQKWPMEENTQHDN